MKVSEEKILDYIDGILSQKEEKEIREAIEKDQDIKNIFLDLKKGKELGEAAFLYDVTNAPELPQLEKKTIKKSWFSKFKNTPFISTAVAASITLAFLGGVQTQVALDNNSKFENGVVSIDSDFLTLGSKIRGLEDNYKFEQWFIRSNFALIIRIRRDNDAEWMQITEKDNVPIGYQIQFVMQTVKNEKNILIDMLDKDKNIESTIENIKIKPGQLVKESRLIGNEKGLKEIVFYEYDSNQEKNIIGTFLLSVINK